MKCSAEDYLTLWLKDNLSEGPEEIKVNSLRANFANSGYSGSLFYGIFSLIRKNRIRVQFSKNHPDALRVVLFENGCSENPGDRKLQQFLSSVHAFTSLEETDSVIRFGEMTSGYFDRLTLFTYLKCIGADMADVKMMCCFLSTFFAQDLPLSLQDLHMGMKKTATLYGQIRKGQHILQRHELLEFAKESVGMHIEHVLTPALIRLLNNTLMEKYPLAFSDQKGLFRQMDWRDIPTRQLFFNDTCSALIACFDKFIRMEQNLSVLLYGKPGTGKTELVYQLARQTQSTLVQLNFSHIHSKWVGEAEKNIHSVFREYRELRKESSGPVIMLINEADGFMNRRTGIQQSNDAFHNQLQTAMLELLESFEGIVFATTNLFQNLDEAFHRRFLFKYEVEMPDRQTRSKILEHSACFQNLTEELKRHIAKMDWSPAEFANFEKKFSLLSAADLTHLYTLETLFFEGDGKDYEKKPIGFGFTNQIK
jgi:hypothetical protein